MRRCAWSRWIAVVAVLVALPGNAAGAGAQPRPVLEGVPELEKRVTYTETKIPLGELVAKVSQDTGVALAAAKDVADEPVAVVVKELPARELLEHLATLLDYQWTARRRTTSDERRPPNTPTPQHPNTSTRTFEVYQDLASKQREEALRQATQSDVERRFREEVARAVQVAALPTEQIEPLKEVAMGRVKERKSLRPEHQLAIQLAAPVSRALAQLLGRLSVEHWALLRRSEPLILATEPEAGELPLPAELLRVLRAARPEMNIETSAPNAEIAEGQRRRHQAEADAWASAPGFRVTIRLRAGRLPNIGSLSLSAAAEPARKIALPRFDPAHPGVFPGYRGSSFEGGTGTRLSLFAPAVVRPPDGFDDTAVRDPRIVTDPVFGAKKRFEPDPKPRPNHLGVRPRYRFRPTYRDLMPDLARTYGIQFIADAYRITGRAGGSWPLQLAPLYAMLDRLSWSNDRWERHGNLVLVRSRTWFLDRPREIPLRFVRRWKQSCDRYGVLSLEEWIEAANALTDLQLEDVNQVGSEADLPGDFWYGWQGGPGPVVRLYSSLNPVQQQALWQGRSVPVARMAPRQRALFVEALRAVLEESSERIDLTRVAEGGLAMHRQDMIRTHRPTSGGGLATSEPLPTVGDAAAHGTARTLPPRTRVTSRDGVTRFVLTSLVFQLFFGPEWPAGMQINVRTPP